jgi:Bacterial RNA polymerase, alpha chain C terminal domain
MYVHSGNGVTAAMHRLLAPLTTWADALRAGRPVEVALAESVTISVRRAEVKFTQDGQVAQIDDDAVATLLAVLLLRDLIGAGPATPVHPDGTHVITLDCPLRCLGLSRHAYRPLMLELRDRGPVTVRDLVASDEEDLRDIRNLGRGRIAEIKSKLAQAGFCLGGS